MMAQASGSRGPQEDLEEDEVADAGRCLYEKILALKMSGKLSATDACVLAYWASKAGAQGPVAKLAKAPGDEQHGHYSRKFDAATGVDVHDSCHYILQVPQHFRPDGCRALRPLGAIPVQEALARELDEDPHFQEKLTRCAGELPPAYRHHKVVREALPQLAVPLALYLDGIQYATRDSILGVFAVNLATQKRHLVCSLRKRNLCRCGCLGWCSLWPIFHFLHWCFSCLAKGQSPRVRHDQQPFGQHEAHRAAAAGQPLGFRAALLYLKADLAEYAHTLGFPSTASHSHPCFLCQAKADQLVLLDGWDAVSLPWGPKTPEDYEEACGRCEQWRVVPDQATHTQLRALLDFDKRKTSSSARGLALTQPYPKLDLLKGDRLEPNETLPDIGLFDELAVFPTQVLFWRRQVEGLTHHRNPLFSAETGISHESAALDWLHTLSLGVFQTWCSYTMHMLFKADAWQTYEGTEEARIARSLQRLSPELDAWQKQLLKQGRSITQIGGLEPSMFGTWNAPVFKLKGAETNFFLEFLVGILPRFRWALLEEYEPLELAGRCLMELLTLIRTYPVTFPAAAIQGFFNSAKRYLYLMGHTVGLHFKPKDHMLLHMCRDIAYKGAPGLYGNWVDESINRILRDVAASSHAATQDRRILAEFPRAMELHASTRNMRARTA